MRALLPSLVAVPIGWLVVVLIACGSASPAPALPHRPRAAAVSEPTEATARAAPPAAFVDDIARPTRWQPIVRRCFRRYRLRWCDGPRRVPMPEGEAAARARALALGTHDTAAHLLNHPPRSDWVEAVGTLPGSDLLWPVSTGRFGRGFGAPRRGRRGVHKGIDIAAPGGTRVRAVNDGLVAYADNGVRGMGNLVLLVHGDATVTLYAHLRAAYVFAGMRVGRGQTIGEVGSTGLARGPHLHFQWQVEGRPRNPIRRFAGKPEP